MTKPRPASMDAGHATADPAGLLGALRGGVVDTSLTAETRQLLALAASVIERAHSEIQAERLRYRALFDAVPDPVSVIAFDGTVLDLNRAGMKAYNRPRDEIVGQPIHVLNPDLPRDHMLPVLDTLRRGDTYVVEVTNMRADGSRFPVEVHSANFHYEGREDVLVAVARDLSQRQEAEIRYRELMELIDKGIVIQDTAGRFVYGNSAALRILGIGNQESLAEAMGDEHWLILREDGSPMPLEEYPATRAMTTGRIIESTLMGMQHRQRRQMIWLSVTVVPQFAPGASTPHQMLSLFSDVTAIKRDSAMFDRVQALAHIGGWEWDCASDSLYLTHESQRIIGQSEPPASMRELAGCLRSIDGVRLQVAAEAALQAGSHFDLELQGMRADKRDFWVRAIGEPMRDGPATTRVSGTLQDITERKQAEETLRVQARSDPLTGLMNRDAALNELEARLADPTQSQVAVLYIDLDRFKVVNDVLGHAAGDQLLVAATERIRRGVGTEGLIARFGGDEFLVICSCGDDPERPQRIAGDILGQFGEAFRFGGEEFGITASIGIAFAPPTGGRPQPMIQNADMAMYDSKRRARNGFQLFTPELAQLQQEKLQLETHLRRAAEEDEFQLVFQPQVDLRSGQVVAAEALIRWNNRKLGEMRPDRFIAHAESTGDIVRIGSWVLHEACRQVAEWRDAGLGIVRVAVNVSYRQFTGDDLPRLVREALEMHRLPGSALELEFTERVLIEDAPDTLKTFADLRALGVMLTIDDFGEGYSALNYLRRLPIHGLKLSQLFVEGVPGNQSDVAVCQAVVGIARSLGLGLVAEGVESEAQRQFLLRLGVPVGQGFLFAPGLPADEFVRQLEGTHVLTHA
ncbi:MAG TPA: EAL domain-containing protein [Xanthomonadaceae bacterium]|nr:EAL domain-containing protein [Xanthomonadaceae bacterium]